MTPAQKANWAGYSPGALPDDIQSITVNSPTQLTMQLTGPVNSYWFTYNELSQITPMPNAWDVTSSGGASISVLSGISAAACASICLSTSHIETTSMGDTWIRRKRSHLPYHPGRLRGPFPRLPNARWPLSEGSSVGDGARRHPSHRHLTDGHDCLNSNELCVRLSPPQACGPVVAGHSPE